MYIGITFCQFLDCNIVSAKMMFKIGDAVDMTHNNNIVSNQLLIGNLFRHKYTDG